MTDIDRFLAIGYGSGAGYGAGSGSSSGCGYCHDYDYGPGYGSGFGYGAGYGSGSGSDAGSGAGAGVGSGSGVGSGLGSDLLEYAGNMVRYIDGVPTVLERVAHGFAFGYIINLDMTTSRCCVAKEGNFFAHGTTPREAANAAHAKAMLHQPPDERVEAFLAAHPSSTRRYNGNDLFRWHHLLTGSCEFGRRRFCEDHGIDPEKTKMTVAEFCKLTRDQYGGDVIRLLEKKLKRR